MTIGAARHIHSGGGIGSAGENVFNTENEFSWPLQKRRGGPIAAYQQTDIFELPAKIAGNANAGQDGVSAPGDYLLKYNLRVFKTRDSAISRTMIHRYNHGAPVRTKETLKASACNVTHCHPSFCTKTQGVPNNS